MSELTLPSTTRIPGYAVSRTICQLDGFSVYEATRSADGERVLIKAPSRDFPQIVEVERLDHEVAILAPPAPASVLKPLIRLDSHENSYLVYEHFDGQPLAPFGELGDPAEFCRLGASFLRALSACHTQGIVHACLSLNCVWWSPATGDIKISHFVCATRRELSSQSARQIRTPCTAPEQTGRLNVSIDERVDLYSAGAVLYYLLTGCYPFDDSDDWPSFAHSLVAREPAPIASLRSNTPKAVAEIVSRLLAKSPSDRPTSALAAAEEFEALARPELGESTVLSVAALPETTLMLGRDRELATLSGVLEGAARGEVRTATIEGQAGSGKSRLIEELARSAAAERNLVAIGKFEQFRQNRPYSALLQAVESVLDAFLSAPQVELDYWRNRFESIDPALLCVLAEQIRPIQLMVGQQPKPIRLGLAETENRFHRAFLELMRALCDAAHPFVLVLDDLQWSDDETVRILAELFFKSRHAFLALILAYRPPEPGTRAPILQLLELIGGPIEPAPVRIELGQLKDSDIAAMCESMIRPCADSVALAELVQRRSRGNPLLAIEVIKRLARTGALHWTRSGEGAAWRLDRLGQQSDPPALDNIVDLIVSRIDVLPGPCRLMLKAAACLGHRFGFSELESATELEPGVLLEAIEVACTEGLIQPDAGRQGAPTRPGHSSTGHDVLKFRFFHDRVQQAAYSSCNEQERDTLHLRIGRTKLALVGENRRSLFPAVEHLNQVHELLQPEERRRLTESNIVAARIAKESIAYASAVSLLRTALTMRANSPDSADSRVQFECHLQLAECLYLHRDLEAAETEFETALSLAPSVADEVEVHRTRLVLYQHMQRYDEAIALGLRALELLRVSLPERPSPPRLMLSLALVLRRTRRVTPTVLRQRADRASETDRMVLELLVLLWTPSFWTNQQLNALVVLKLVSGILRFGNTPQAPMAYVCFAILQHVLFKRHERALEFGQLAAQLVDDTTDPLIASRVRFLSLTFFGALERSNQENVRMYEQALEKCLQTGEHVFAGHTLDGIATSLPVHGFRLPEIERRLQECANVAEQIRSETSLELVRITQAWCRALSEPHGGAAPTMEVGELRYDSYVGVLGLLRMMLQYLWDDDRGVLELAEQLRRNVVVQSNPSHASLYALFWVLAACRSGARKRSISKLIARIARFESIFSQNFASMLFLARAEAALCQGQIRAALDFYHRAVAEAGTRRHDLVHAIACERLSSLYEARGDGVLRQKYLAVAAYGYERFGAFAKVAQLRVKYPESTLSGQPGEPRVLHAKAADLDAEAVMRAAYAIAEETRSGRPAESLLRVITTATGGQRGVLLKVRADATLEVLSEWETESLTRSDSGRVPQSVVRYVARTGSAVELHDATDDPRFRSEPYLKESRPRSLLCLPLMHRGEVSAVLYLENSVCADVFTEAQSRLATMLGHHAAIAMAIADYHKVQMDALQARINPHFLHNTLSAIAELVRHDPVNAERAILKLSHLYHYILTSTSDQVVTLEHELGVLRDYLALEQHRFRDRLRVAFEIEGPTDRVYVPALILQPLAENSVRHGVARKMTPGTVSIKVVVSETACLMRVEDDGPGWKENQRAGTGFGLRSVKERLALLYGSDFEFEVQKNAGVTVSVRIPLTLAQSRPPHAARVVSQIVSRQLRPSDDTSQDHRQEVRRS